MKRKTGRIQGICGIVILGSILSKLIFNLEFSKLDLILTIFGLVFAVTGFLIMKQYPDDK